MFIRVDCSADAFGFDREAVYINSDNILYAKRVRFTDVPTVVVVMREHVKIQALFLTKAEVEKFLESLPLLTLKGADNEII